MSESVQAGESAMNNMQQVNDRLARQLICTHLWKQIPDGEGGPWYQCDRCQLVVHGFCPIPDVDHEWGDHIAGLSGWWTCRKCGMHVDGGPHDGGPYYAGRGQALPPCSGKLPPPPPHEGQKIQAGVCCPKCSGWCHVSGPLGCTCGTIKEMCTPPQEPLEEPPSIYDRPIQEHGGGKYLRKIYPADGKGEPILVDVYCVIEAFMAGCPILNMAPLQHAVKKLLCCGVRGKGSELDDMHGVFDAMWRALELYKQRGEADGQERMGNE